MSSKRPSREPSEYFQTFHFEDGFEDEMRFLEPDMIDQIIIRGHDFMHEGGPEKMRRKLDFDGVYGVLVIALDDPVLITGWTEINSMVEAMQSDRWTAAELQKIDAFEKKLHKENTVNLNIKAWKS